jgi:hypothetical protein
LVTKKAVLVFVVFTGSLFCLFYLWDTLFVRLGLMHEGTRRVAVIGASALSIISFLLFCGILSQTLRKDKKRVRRENVPSKTTL